MAEFNTDLTVKPTQSGSSIGDMLNLARGALAYQQEQQINPIKLKQAEQEFETGKVGLQEKKLKYQNLQQDILNQTFSSMLQDPAILQGKDPDAITKVILDRKREVLARGVDPYQVEIGAAHLISEAHKNPASVVNVLGNVLRSQLSGAEQQSNIRGSVVGYGKDVQGNPTVIMRNPATGEQYEQPLPVGGGTQNIPQMRIGMGESPETISAFQSERGDAKSHASKAAPALANIQAVRKYLPMAQLGKGSESIAGLQSVFGNLAGSTAEEKAASARDIIEKSIADLAAQKNSALGGKFQADLANAQNSIASAGKNPTAILKSMQMLEPLVQHSVNYQQGLENAISKYGTVQVKRAFDNAMISAFDPQAVMVYNAYKSGNEKEFNELTKGMTDKQKNQLGAKMQRYQRLIEGNLQ